MLSLFTVEPDTLELLKKENTAPQKTNVGPHDNHEDLHSIMSENRLLLATEKTTKHLLSLANNLFTETFLLAIAIKIAKAAACEL